MSVASLAVRYRQFAPRERRFLAVGAIATAALLGWVLVFEPLDARIAAAQARRDLAADTLGYLDSIAAGVQAARQDRAMHADLPAGQTLLSTLNQSAREHGLSESLRRVTPRPDGSASLVLNEVTFDRFAAWLVSLQERFGIGVRRIAVSVRREPGQVDTTVELAASGRSDERVHLEDR